MKIPIVKLVAINLLLPAIVIASDKAKSLIGTWALEISNSSETAITFVFNDDGTVVYSEEDFSDTANYSIVDGAKISIEKGDIPPLVLRYKWDNEFLLMKKIGDQEFGRFTRKAEQAGARNGE